MESIFDPVSNQKLISRIELLEENTAPKWGIMNAAQMLSHCMGPIDVAFGTLKLKPNFLFAILGKIFKKKILAANGFKRNSPTVKEFIRTESEDFEKVKSEIILKIKRFSSEGSDVIVNKKHPFFGRMTIEEWDTLQWKHLNHHLKQFGV